MRHIVIEGPDKVGKTTQANLLKEAFGRRSIPAEMFHPFEATPKLKEVIQVAREIETKQPLRAEVMIAQVHKVYLEEVVQPLLANGTYVISDRSQMSTEVYKTHVLGSKTIFQIVNETTGTVSADVVIIMRPSSKRLLDVHDRNEMWVKKHYNLVTSNYYRAALRAIECNRNVTFIFADELNPHDSVEPVHRKIVDFVNRTTLKESDHKLDYLI